MCCVRHIGLRTVANSLFRAHFLTASATRIGVFSTIIRVWCRVLLIHKMARPRNRRIASEDSDSGNSKDVAKKTKEKGVSSTRKRKQSTFVVSIPKTRVKLPAVEADPPRKLIVQSNSSASSSPLPSSIVSYANRPSFPGGPLSFKNKSYQVSCPPHHDIHPASVRS